jgi:serine/threonine-protein kinase
MPLAPGDKLGPYEIIALIGAGGMGEVFRGRDIRLHREVAIKVLPFSLAHDPERLARFEREAKVLASLNHPNIAQIYSVEDSGGVRALAMELVPGANIAGPLPVDTVIEYARQIASALEAAHEKGIVHRDLKPANIMVTPDGVVKVLDFGLARLNTGESDDPSNSPTMMTSPTQAGIILGTAGYMSPEQARGKVVDKRADIWAFGVVLYEIVTGKPLFRGETVTDVLANVMKEEPDLSAVPVKVRRLLSSCLEKDAKKRLRDIGDWGRQLDEAATTAPSRSRLGTGWIVAAVLAVALGLFAYRAPRPAAPKPLVRLDVDLGADVSLSSLVGASAILSPDGTRLVYVSKGKLFTRRLDQPKARELAGTDGAYAPFFSPDGEWVAFFTRGKLKKVSVEGGAPVVLCDAQGLRDVPSPGGSWGEDGNIIASLAVTGALSRISADGGAPAPATQLATGEGLQRWPQVLPGGKAVLFTSNNSRIDVFSFAGRRRKTIVPAGVFGKYVAASNGVGYLLYLNNGTLFAIGFDASALETRGVAVPVVEQVAWNPGPGSAQFDVSQTGVLLYQAGVAGAGDQATVQWLDGQGRMQPLLAKPGRYSRPRLSPDGQRLAVVIVTRAGGDIWLYEPQRDTMTRLTFDAVSGVPVWSPDGRYVVFQGRGGMYWTRSDGAGKPQALTQSGNLQFPSSFTPDGKRLAWFELAAGTARDLWTMPLESSPDNPSAGLRAGKPEIFLQTSAEERNPAFSPDGRWLAYASNESGTDQVYVRAFPDRGGKWQISNADGINPVWSRSGRELFFRSLENRIMVAAYAVKGDSFTADQPKLWSEKHLANTGVNQNFDVAPDGKRIAVLMPVETPETQQAQHQVIFLENFLDELRRKLPPGGK